MALTVVLRKVWVNGDRKDVIADVTFDASYATGGLALTGTQLGLDLEMNYLDAATGNAGNTFSYDYSAVKLKAFAGATEVANATNLSTVTCRVRAVGKGSASA